MSQNISLQWFDVSLEHRKTKKKILSGLNGKANSGDFLTVMGQSGAGKSSFLSIITARITPKTSDFKMEGECLLNGKSYGFKEFGKHAAYVRQDDLLMGTLTVEETFEFQASLKLYQLSKVEQSYKINQILKNLGLQDCRKTLVGGYFSKSISGGQRKRVAIGVELLADPQCLILDEPTSGLDSTNSLKLLKILKNLAKEGRVILATIHQPSTLMFMEMDKLFIIGKGQTLYFGEANQIVPYMLSIGIQVNVRMNPADFFMLEISEFKKNQGYETPMTPQNFLKHQQNLNQNALVSSRVSEKEEEFQEKEISSDRKQPGIIKEFPILFRRSYKNFFRTISNLYGKVLVLVIIPVLLATLYFDIGNDLPENIFDEKQMETYLEKMGAFMFMLAFFVFGMNIYDTVLAYPSEKQLVLKETSSRLYSIFTYYCCRCLIQIPIVTVIGIASVTITYFLNSLDPSFETFILTILITSLVGLCGYMFGSFLGIIFSTSQHAIQMLPIILIPVILLGGLVVNLNSVPEYARWMQYLSPIRHSYSAILIAQLSTDHFQKIIDLPVVGDLVRTKLGVNGDYWENLGYLCILVAGSSIASIAVLLLKRKPV